MGNSKFKVEFDQSALTDVQDSKFWYESQKIGLGDRFVAYVLETINSILSAPESYPINHKRYRAARVPIFPFIIIFRIEQNKRLILILRVFHTKRNPRNKYK